MKFRNMLLAGGFLVIAIGASGCGREGNKGGAKGGSGGAGGAGGAGSDAGAVQQASARFAHLSPDAPAVDVCLLPAGAQADPNAKPVGPIFKQHFADADGLKYGEVSSYLEIPAGQYTVRLVEPNAQNCDKALTGTKDQTGLALRANTFHTAAAMGQLNPQSGAQALQVALFEDDLSPEAGKAKMRFIHASPDAGSIDVGSIDAQDAFTPLFAGVVFGQTGAGKGSDDYVADAPLDDAMLSVRPAGQDNDLLRVPNVNVEADRVVTVFAIGNESGQGEPLRLLICHDERPGAQPAGQGGSNALTTCSMSP